MLSVLLLSCRQETFVSGSEAEPSFIASLGGEPLSKAVPYRGESLPTDVSLGVMAFKYTVSGAPCSQWELHAHTEAVYDGRQSGISSGKWVPAVRFFWPGVAYSVRYFAYAPYDAPGMVTNAASGSDPSLRYTVPPLSDQRDLLVSDQASTREYHGSPDISSIDVPVRMVHALTGIRFRVAEGMAIASVKVSGVYDSGILSLSSPVEWIGQSGSASYELTQLSLGNGLHADPDHPGYYLVDDDKMMLLMPQLLPPEREN